MSKYRITLTPIDKFFFGGDMTFSVGKTTDDIKKAKKDKKEITDKDEQEATFNERFSSYIIRSMMFPQQTSLLGMLRFLILRNAGPTIFSNNKIIDTKAAEKIIGHQSFSVNADHHANNFGLIRSISQVKVARKDNGEITEFDFCPLMNGITLNEATMGLLNMQQISIPNISEDKYKAKNGLTNSNKLTNGKDTIDLINKDEGIFVEDRRIGVNRNIITGLTDDDALFKQISYRFNSKLGNFCFVFYADIDDSLPLLNYDGEIVAIGGDNSQFVINISAKTMPETSITADANTICLLSPTYIDNNVVRKASFAITTLMPFRFLTSKIDVKSYHILSGELKRDKKYELYAPGSVFFFDSREERDAFARGIDSYEEFKQIGYNQYK